MTADRDVMRLLAAAIDERSPVALATVVATRRSVPRHAGAKMLVYGDGRTVGTVGGGAMESRVVAEALASLRTETPKLVDYELLEPARGDPGVCGGEVHVYLEPFMPPRSVLIVGAGHVGRAVVELAHWLGFRTVVVDDRAEQLEGLDDADLVLEGSVAEVLAGTELDENTYVIVVSRDVEIDAAAIQALVGAPVRYLGVMGSARRWKVVRDRLLAEGLSEPELDRIHAPIGLDLGAETVEEIAVSILGEVIRFVRGGTGEAQTA